HGGGFGGEDAARAAAKITAALYWKAPAPWPRASPGNRRRQKGPLVTASPLLLDDAAMRRFIIEGYLVLKPDLPVDFHGRIYHRLEEVLAGGNPGNNLLPRVPELQHVLDHPAVHGALTSLLGSDYYLHLHRHVHANPPGSKGQNLHKDSLYNSRFAVDEKRRHHRTRWLMIFYYPQDTPLELDPSAIIPRSHYLITDPPQAVDEVCLVRLAGTTTIVY